MTEITMEKTKIGQRANWVKSQLVKMTINWPNQVLAKMTITTIGRKIDQKVNWPK